MTQPQVELWTWSGCPSHDAAMSQLATALDELGHADLAVEVRWIETDEEATRLDFVGSPTIVVNGEDVLPEPSAPVGLSCRVYRRRDGRISPLPDPQDLRDALGERLAAVH
jgi:hypothetical protein